MASLKALAYDCRRATRLIEQKQFEGISLRQDLQLQFHLVGCSYCRLYQQHSVLISKVMKGVLRPKATGTKILSGAQKGQMQAAIDQQLQGGK